MKTPLVQKVVSILGLIELVVFVPCLIVLLQTMDTYLRSPNSLKTVAALSERFAVRQQTMNAVEVGKLSKVLYANSELLFWSLIANMFLLVLVFCSGALMVRVKAMGPVLATWRSATTEAAK